MIDAVLDWSKENIGEYVKYIMLHRNKNTKLYMTLYVVFMALIAIISIVTAIFTKMMWLFAAAVCSVLLIAFFIFVLLFAVKKYTNDIYEVSKNNDYDGIEITASCICFKRNDSMVGKLGWEGIESVDFYNDYVFFSAVQGFIFIISKQNIKSGSIDELKKIVDEKLVKQGD